MGKLTARTSVLAPDRLAQIYQRAGQKEPAAREIEIYKRLKDREADAGSQKKITP